MGDRHTGDIAAHVLSKLLPRSFVLVWESEEGNKYVEISGQPKASTIAALRTILRRLEGDQPS